MTSPDALPGPAPSGRAGPQGVPEEPVSEVSLPSPVGTASSQWAIQNLIAAYAELLDDGDFAGLGALLADATFTGSGPPVSGSAAIEAMFRDMLIVYADSTPKTPKTLKTPQTPRTSHVTTNIAIAVDEEAGTAVARSYFTVLQALPDLPLQSIASGRYHDRFERSGGQWRFAARRATVVLVGDVSRHLRHAR
jgi:3-phenylpropionate/cinnamic acid dioxygenase small subunit